MSSLPEFHSINGQQMDGVDDFLMLDSDDAPGPGTTMSSIDCNMGSCSSTIIASNLQGGTGI